MKFIYIERNIIVCYSFVLVIIQNIERDIYFHFMNHYHYNLCNCCIIIYFWEHEKNKKQNKNKGDFF